MYKRSPAISEPTRTLVIARSLRRSNLASVYYCVLARFAKRLPSAVLRSARNDQQSFFNKYIILPLAIFFLCLTTARATEITGAEWKGADFIVSFSDSASYQLDLVASDSTQLVIRIDNAVLAPGLRNTTEIPGPDHRKALLTLASDNTLRLTVMDSERLGYSTLWRPYSHRLILHTFQWGKLGYADEQYHKGLIALEQGLYTEAEELLAVAYATGEQRAGSVLGTYYARQRKDSLAARYLQAPLDADDYAAQADLQRHRGDSSGAETQQRQFQQMIVNDKTTGATDTNTTRKSTENGMGIDVLDDPWLIGIGLGVLLLVVLLITWSVRRGSRLEHEKTERRRVPDEPMREPVVQRMPPVEKEAHVVERTEPTATIVQEPVISPPVEQIPIEVQPEPAPIAPTVEPPSRRPTAFTRADIYREPYQSTQSIPEPAIPHEKAHETIPEHEPLRDPELQQIEEVTHRQDLFVRHTPPAEIIPDAEPTRPVPRAEESASTPAVARASEVSTAPAVELAPIAAQEPPAKQSILSTQARELQRKIQSRRPDQPAPAEPTKSAARRLNISRDNVELRRMIEDARKKK